MAFGFIFGGSRSKGRETISTGPWIKQQPYLERGFGRAENLFNQPLDPSINRGYGLLEDVAGGFDPRGFINIGGQALQGAGANLGMGNQALSTLLDPRQLSPESNPYLGRYVSTLLDPRQLSPESNPYLGRYVSTLLDPRMLNPDANPYLGRYAEGLARPIVQNLTERILPSIRSDAISSGGYGGSRQGIAEGIASRGAAEAIGDRTAQLYSGAYGQGLNAMTDAAGIYSNAIGQGRNAMTDAAGIYSNAIGQGRNAMLGAAGMLPGYAQTNLGIAGAAPRFGAESFNLQRLPAEATLEAGMGRQMLPWQMLQNYMAMIRGDYGREGVGTTRGSNLGFGFSAEAK